MKKIRLTENQYKKLQQNLIESVLLTEATTNEIMQVQQKLKDCFKANLGTYGPKGDGVDGKLGPLTAIAIETYLGIKI